MIDWKGLWILSCRHFQFQSFRVVYHGVIEIRTKSCFFCPVDWEEATNNIIFTRRELFRFSDSLILPLDKLSGILLASSQYNYRLFKVPIIFMRCTLTKSRSHEMCILCRSIVSSNVPQRMWCRRLRAHDNCLWIADDNS